jgi:hypothetical protein
MKNNLRKATKKGLAVVSAMMGMSVLFAACSTTEDDRISGGVSEDAGFVADVAGVAQKGPFVKGSAVTVRGIDCKTLEFTDQIFEGTIKSDKGDFALDSVALDMSCAVIEVTGKYLNEVTGKKTKDELTLRALTDLKDRENVNVNLLTNLEYERVMHLVKEKNNTLAKAKAQAESEVLAAFDIKGEFGEFENLNLFESGDGNAALLAVSVMMQGDADAAGLAKRLDKFDDSFAESGEWKDDATKAAISEWVTEAAASGKLDTIRANVESWSDADVVAAFEKFVPAVATDSVEDVSSSSEETVSSSSEAAGTEKVSSSSEAAVDSVSSSSVASSSSVVPDSIVDVRSSSSKADTSDIVSNPDTTAHDTIVPDTTARDTSVQDTGSVNPDTSATANDTACTDTKFPYEMEYLIGNGYEVVSARCVGDSIVVDWRSQHVIHEIEVSDSGTYVFSTDYEKDVMDSLARLRSEWLDEGSGFVSRGSINADRDELAMDVYGYSYSDRGINASMGRIDNVTSLYSFTMNLKYAAYFIRAFSAPEVLVAASGSRTVRYGFVVELSAIYLSK